MRFWRVKQAAAIMAVGFAVLVAARLSVSADSTDLPPQVYILRSGTTGSAQRCDSESQSERDQSVRLIERLAKAKLLLYSPVVHKELDRDPLLEYIFERKRIEPSGAYRRARVVLVTYCRTGDVYTASVVGYAMTFDDKNPAKPKTLSNKLSGTFDALATSDWKPLVEPTDTPLLIPNIAFLPVPNDTTNTVNSALLHNLPLTVLQTPAPLPTASPAAGVASTPMSLLAACQQSQYHMVVIGRTIVQDAASANDIAKLLTGAAAVTQSAPSPWGGIYTGLGLGLAWLYSPNSADVAADVMACTPPPPDQPDQSWAIYWIGGRPITGHARTPMFNASPVQIQHALNFAASDLENQLYCIIKKVLYEHGVSLSASSVFKEGMVSSKLSPNAQKYNEWCDKYYAPLSVTTTTLSLPEYAPVEHPMVKTDLLPSL